jgi:hypothetical protein
MHCMLSVIFFVSLSLSMLISIDYILQDNKLLFEFGRRTRKDCHGEMVA